MLLGVRDIHFVRRTGLDALTATQDVPLGVQLGMQVGRSSPMLGATEEDFFLAGDLYVGLSRSPHTTTRLQLQGEGRRVVGRRAVGRRAHDRAADAPDHDHAVAARHVALEWAGGYQQRTPFQLLLGVPEGGVRGYENRESPGGQRLVARVRASVHVRPGACGVADIGFAVFADAGPAVGGRRAVRRDDAGRRASIGFSLLAAVPHAIGADVASGFRRCRSTEGRARRLTLRFTNADRTAFVFRDARDVATGRELTVPSSIFAWP